MALHNLKVNDVIRPKTNTQAACPFIVSNMINLVLLLKEIHAGKHVFGPEGDSVIDIDAFQHTAKLLADAEQKGYLLGYYPMYSESSKYCWCDLVMVDGLKQEGKQFLSSQTRMN